MKGAERVNVLGVGIDPLTAAELLERASALARDGGRYRVMYANVHVLNTAYRDGTLRRILNAADVVYCDGGGVVLGARLLGQALPERMTGADWIYPACSRWQEEGLSVFFCGGVPGVAEAAAAKLQGRYPRLRVAGHCHGYYPEPLSILEAINLARPDILLVGLGTPTQERWIADNFHRLSVPVVWAVGGLMDFVSGRTARPPRWLRAMGHEWLGRLTTEPTRLWRRYLVGNPLFVGRVLMQRLGRLPGDEGLS